MKLKKLLKAINTDSDVTIRQTYVPGTKETLVPAKAKAEITMGEMKRYGNMEVADIAAVMDTLRGMALVITVKNGLQDGGPDRDEYIAVGRKGAY